MEWNWKAGVGSVAGELDAPGFDRFGKAAADKAEGGSRGIAFWFKREDSGFGGEFVAAVELQTGVFQKFGGETHVLGAVDAPEPELFLIALEEVQGFFELLHRAIERGGQKEDSQGPGVTWVLHAHPDAIFAVLILFNAAAVVVA